MNSNPGSVRDRRIFAQQIAVYGLVGASTNLLGLIIYYVVTFSCTIEPLLAASLVYVLISYGSYHANRCLTFNSHKRVAKTLPRYVAVQTLGLVAQLGINMALVTHMRISHIYAQPITISIVSVILFTLAKYSVFR